VALEIQITPELRREGLAREAIRLVQDARKADGLEVTDRIEMRWQSGNPDVVQALTEHGELIAGEVLAVEFHRMEPGSVGPEASGDAVVAHADEALDLKFWLRRA
jgi:isoleucyl-tRNA synthetase